MSEQQIAPSPFWHATGVLAERYMSVIVADFGATLLWLMQAPLIGACIALAWQEGVQGSRRINFVLAFASILFGCINAFREVIKERPIFLREQRLGVPVSAYLLSKLMVLALVGFVQCLALTLIVDSQVPSYKLSQAPLMILLFAGSLAGTSLGLLVSCFVRSQEGAVALLPVVLLPQLIFSEAVLGSTANRPEEIELMLPVAWVYKGLQELWESNWHFSSVLTSLIMLAVLSAVFMFAAWFVLSLAAEE
jgi:ABC transport system ATP-binding/permease protein